jgi:hypothetical protein
LMVTFDRKSNQNSPVKSKNMTAFLDPQLWLLRNSLRSDILAAQGIVPKNPISFSNGRNPNSSALQEISAIRSEPGSVCSYG